MKLALSEEQLVIAKYLGRLVRIFVPDARFELGVRRFLARTSLGIRDETGKRPVW